MECSFILNGNARFVETIAPVRRTSYMNIRKAMYLSITVDLNQIYGQPIKALRGQGGGLSHKAQFH